MNRVIKSLFLCVFFILSGSRIIYGQQYTITLNTNPTCGGTTSGSGAYASGAVANITVAPLDGYNFLNWTDQNGLVYQTLPSFSVTIAGNSTFTANFTLTWSKSGNNISFSGGNVGIGTQNPDAPLTVNGKIHTTEVQVSAVGADFVFDEGYKLKPLEEVESYIKTNKHLPEIPSAEEVKQNGMELGQMEMKLLQKIEELTLYAIELKKENVEKRKMIESLKLR